MPDKVVLRCADTDELLGLMAYIVDGRNLAMEIVYVESVDHSNANPLYAEGRTKMCIRDRKNEEIYWNCKSPVCLCGVYFN